MKISELADQVRDIPLRDVLEHYGFETKPEGVAVFWPAAGIAIGALIALGPDARLPVAAAVAVATITSKL